MVKVSVSVTTKEAKGKKYVGYYDFYSVRVDLSKDKEKLPNIEYVKGDFVLR